VRGKMGPVLFILGSALIVFGILRLLGTIPVRARTLGTTLVCMTPIHYLSSSTASPRTACIRPLDHATAEAIAACAVGCVLLVIAGIIGLNALGD
jgi:hypothetical protein